MGISRKTILIITVFSLIACGLFYILTAGFGAAAEPAVNPHGNYDINSLCHNCHSTHGSTGAYLLTWSTQRETCYSCHDGHNASPNIRGEFGEETIGSSVYSDTGSLHPVPAGTQKCTNCHDPHLANEKSAGGTAGLLAVGEDAYSSGNSVCGACHGSGSSLPGGDMLTDFVYSPHDINMEAPASGTGIKCARCHQPHGSPYDMLLRNTITGPGGVVYQVSGNNNSVCFGCHTVGTGGYSGSAVFNATYHGSKTSSTVATTTYSGTEYEATLCMNCHEPHGKTGVSYYRRAEGNALCTTCHDDESVVRPDDYSYRGIDTYNDTPHASADPPPGVYTYNAGTGGTEVWEAYGPLGQQPTPSSPGTPASAGDKSKAASSDGVHWATGSALDQEYNFHVFKFHVNQNLINLRELSGKWIGYGEPTTGYPTELFIWNENTPGWEALASQQLGSPGTFTWLRTSDFDRYLDENNDIYILARAKHDGTGPVVSSWGPRFNTTSKWADIVWTTDEEATTRVDYGTTTAYGTHLTVAGYRTSHSVRLSDLVAGQTYYYKITTVDRLGNETVETSSFVARCGSPVLTPEGDMEQDSVFEFNVTLEWNSVPDLDSQAVTYDIQISKAADFSSTYAQLTDTSSTSWATTITHSGGINTSNTWYWRVRAKDSYGSVSDWSTDSFTTWVNSCPILYTWNGEKFEYNTDIVAGAIVGLEMSPGQYKPPVPDEQVTISGDLLKEKDGYYVLKIKNEQHEVDFIDNLVLEAVDHPVDTRIGLNDFVRRAEPYKVYTYSKNLNPVKKATYVNNPTWSGGDAGAPIDVTELVSRIDNRHAVGKLFDDNQFTLELGDLSDAQEVKLVIVGWTEFATAADRELRVQTAVENRPTAKHYVEVLQTDGTWKSEEIKHIPGYTKTAVIDLTGKFAEDTKEYVVRLRGLYRPHLDFIGVDTTPQADITVTPLRLDSAELNYATPASYIKFPSPYFDYYDGRNFNLWTHEGSFTRYGDVLPLVRQIDDKLVVMDTGDELTVSFKALPPPAAGMTRSFVLKPWGYYKELSEAKVEPMPFRDMDMSLYPDSLGEYPQELKEYVKEWNTRVHKAGDNSVQNNKEIRTYDRGQPGILQRFKLLATRVFDWVAVKLDNLAGGFTTDRPTDKSSAIPSNSKRLAANPVNHYSLNTDYVELEVRAVDPGVSEGYCGNCHTPHGKADASGNPFPKQLQMGQSSTCFGGGLGCHSDPDNSVHGVNLYDKFTASSNPLSHHSVDPAEQTAQGTKLDCFNCHEPHLNTATDRLVDPDNRYSIYSLTSNIPEYVDESGEVYLRVRAKHDGQEPAFATNPYVSAMNETTASIAWSTNEKTSGYMEYGPTTAYGTQVNKNFLATSFTAGLSGLELYTNYHYRVYAVDPSGNYVFSDDRVLDSTPPVITSGPSIVNSTGTAFDVIWQTNEKTSRWVEYNDTVSYAVYGFAYSEGTNSSPGTSHSVHLSGLVAGTEYTYRLKSQDLRGNTTTSENFTIMTSRSPGVPTISTVTDSAPDEFNFTLGAVWGAVYDPDPGDTVEYYIQGSTTSNFTNTIGNSGWISTTSWDIAQSCDYDAVITYYFRVKSRDNWGTESAWSTVKSITHYGPPSSCPVLYTWDGEGFEFITDLASSNVGLETAPGQYSVPIPDLPVIIPWGKLQEKDGLYTIKIKTERDEVDFIDNLVLQAVDHPEGTRLALNDFQRGDNPPVIHSYAKDIKPVKRATYINNPTYNGGQKSKPVDITAEVSKIDNRHASGTLLDDNEFIFDLGDLSGAKNIKLVAIGWTEYADARERAQRVENIKKGIKPAARLLEILQPDGTWKSEKIKHFSGYTKPVAIDLTGKFPKGTTKYIVRLRGMYRPHFDFIGVDTTPDSIAKKTSLKPLTAQLQFRGMAKYTKFPSPYHDYDNLTVKTLVHEGRFTRYGDVLPLVKKIDDKMVAMDTGDELTVTFKALPPPAPGMTRTFVLKPWQYYKEYQFAKTYPMPFRDMDMSKWPDSLGEYPRELQEYVAEWNTRIHGDANDIAEYRSNEDKSGILTRLKGFLGGILDGLQGLWARLFGGPDVRTAESVYQEIPYQPHYYPEDFLEQPPEGHYSLNTNYIKLQADKGTAISVYDANSAGFGMWQSSAEPTPSAPGSPASDEFSAVLSDDSEYFTTDYYPTPNQDDGEYNYQMFRFAINEDPAKLYSFNIFWKGYGENSDGYNVNLGVWNFVYSKWDDVVNQKMGSETSISIPKTVDMKPYCNKCHDGSTPQGVDLGPITRNIGSTYTGDIHGGAGGYQTYQADYGIGRVNGTIKNPYTRGNTTLQCYDCHDLHGSESLYHLKDNPNGQTPGKISGTGLANNTEFLAFCQSCHAGTLYNFHQGCLGCHHEDHGDSNPPMADDFGRACASCHYHGATYPAHSSGCDHCYLNQPVRAF